MKKNIHPEMQKCIVTCACGTTFETLSNTDTHKIEVCSDCHPFYTNKQGKHKKTGAIEKFNKKYSIEEN